jgi:hypothetical protein
VDLLDSAVFVDPGEEARGRVARILENFAERDFPAGMVTEEIAVMTAADRQQLRDVGRAIKAKQPVDFDVFPGYVDREQVHDELVDYASDAEELRAEADYLVTAVADNVDNPELWGLSDDIGERITRMATEREQLLTTAREGAGLVAMERAQLAATVGDIDASRILGHKQLPEVMWADERTKHEADQKRLGRPAARLSTATREALTQAIEGTGVVEPRSRDEGLLKNEVSSIADRIYSVATGPGLSSIEAQRRAYVDNRARLGTALTRAGVPQTAQTEIRTLVDERAREAGKLGGNAAGREQRWTAKTEAVITARDDAIARRRGAAAAEAGHAHAPERTCAARPAAQARTAAPGGRREWRSSEVER